MNLPIGNIDLDGNPSLYGTNEEAMFQAEDF